MATNRTNFFFSGAGGYLAVAGLIAVLLMASEFFLKEPETGAPPTPQTQPVVATIAADAPGTTPATPANALKVLSDLKDSKGRNSATYAPLMPPVTPATPAVPPARPFNAPIFRYHLSANTATRWFPAPKLKITYVPLNLLSGYTPLAWETGDTCFPADNQLHFFDPLADLPFDADLVLSQLTAQEHSSILDKWSLSSSSHLLRDPTQATRTTITPVVLSFLQPLHIPNLETLRPVVSVGAGFLRQTLESGREVQTEMLPVLRAGFGAEWEPLKQVFFRINYEYSRIPVESNLTPDLPEREHAIQTGVEIKF